MAVDLRSQRAYVGFVGSVVDDLRQDMIDLLAPILDELQAEADAIVENEILPNWPVKKGTSRAGWHTEIDQDSEYLTVNVTIRNPVIYARYIKSSKIGRLEDAIRTRHPITMHVRKPATKARRRLKKILPLRLAEIIERQVLNDG